MWWRRVWWIRTDDGPNLRTARGRRRTWCATRAVQADAEQTEEIQKSAQNGVQRFSRKDLLKARTAVQPRQQQPQQQSKQKQQQLQVLHDVVRCVHSVLARTDDTAVLDIETLQDICRRNAVIESRPHHENHTLMDDISRGIHCALCSHSAEEIRHKPMSVAETAMPLF